ncbi:protein tramtrack, beta isoform-like isoform X1 [Chrysoperla carnea]|uniref:protein tramtrack, beta isoform-like isoform X1 n=1 Tax=Chrysoperla carnea TaxID=189513 RepID=UPI001D0685F5|nr:protein tramtrack, beta isoform-like isoform X1 [Chrysoperla carnea]
MSGLEQFSLRWNNFHTNLSTGFHDLLKEEQLVDVTLATEGKLIKAHQLVLSVCSPFFRKIFQINPCKHPVVILNINYHDLRDILTFIYQGEVNVRQEDLAGFLKAAELLQIKGLTGDDHKQDTKSHENTSKNLPQNEENNYKKIDNYPIKIEETHQPPVKRPITLPKSPNYVPNFKKKRPSSIPNHYDFKTFNQSQFLNENSADSTSEQRYYTANVIDLQSSIADSNIDENSMKSHIESTPDDISDSENFHIKSEIDVDDTLISNHSSNLESLMSLQEKENGIFYSIDNIREDPVYFHCSLCNKKFVNRYNLKIHMRDKHSPAEQESLTCELCGKTMRNQSCLRVHKYNHRKQTQILNYPLV